jgi:hypothetical protein
MSDFRPFSDEKLDQFIASGQLKHEKDEAIAERNRRQSDRAEKQTQEQHKALIDVISSQKFKNDPNGHRSAWYDNKIVVGVFIIVVGGLLLTLIRYYFGF